MIEVETKAHVLNFFDTEHLLKNFVFSAGRAYSKNDVYYKNDSFKIRIREDEETIVTFKTKKIIDGFEVSDENEFEISDKDVFIKLLKSLGFEEYYRKTKDGVSYKYRDLTFDLSIVNDLGCFLEIEKLVNDESEIIRAKEEIMEMIMYLRLENSIEQRTYEELILGENHD